MNKYLDSFEQQELDDELYESYPDGWTCVCCGDSYYDEMPANTKEGTICKNCVDTENS